MYSNHTIMAISLPPIGNLESKREFPTQVLIEASSSIISDDLIMPRTEVNGVTIDCEDTLDMDDAIWCVRDGVNFRVSVSISDVASIVEKDSATDKEALHRILTLYLRQEVNPMLPKILSEETLSLVAGQNRPALTFTTTLNKNADILEYEIEQTCLTSQSKLSYLEVNRVLGEADEDFAYYQMLRDLNQIGSALYRKRLGRKIATDSGEYRSDLIVPELMILTNHLAATHLDNHNIPSIFRNHLPSDEYGFKAFYSPRNLGHEGLNLTGYSHTTSPIRRYPDLIVHRQLIASINSQVPAYDYKDTQLLAEYFNRYMSFQDENLDASTKQIYVWQKQKQEVTEIPEETFNEVIVKFCTLPRLPHELVTEFKKRLYEETISHESLAKCLFLSNKDSKQWKVLRSDILTFLENHPRHAFYVLQSSCNEHLADIAELQYEVVKLPNKDYRCRILMMINDKYMSVTSPAYSKKLSISKHRAASSCLNALINGGIVETEFQFDERHVFETQDYTSPEDFETDID